jgi:hypothetical protein
MSKDVREQQRIVDQLKWKLNDKERCDRDRKNAQDKLRRNLSDSSATQDLDRANDQIERIDDDIERLKNQL